MVESISKRYELFDAWRTTGVCTLTGSELESLEAKRRRVCVAVRLKDLLDRLKSCIIS